MAFSREMGKNIRVLSLIHVIIGALSIIIGIVQFATVHHWSSYMAYGLWGGVWILVAGLLGYFGAQNSVNANANANANANVNVNNNSNCLIGTHMAFCIVAGVVSGIFVIVIGVAVGNFNDCIDCHHKGGFDKTTHWDWDWDCGSHVSYRYLSLRECKTGKGLNVFLLVIQLLEFVLAIVSSACCCSAVCCGTATASPGVVFVPAQQTVVTGQTSYIQQGPSPMYTTTTTTGYPQVYPAQQTTLIYPGQGGVVLGAPPGGQVITTTTTPQYPPPYPGAQVIQQ